MQVFEKKLSEITPYENNPRNNDVAVDKVAESISEFGFQQPIVVDADGVVIVGHTRLKAAKKLGMDTVPCVVADNLTDEQVKAYRLADNKTNEFAEWNFELLDTELFEIQDIDMSKFGFDMDAFADKVTDIQEDDFVDDLPDEPMARLGQIWKLGRHRLMCGDATSEADVEILMDGAKADMVFTDPPYGMNLDTDFSGMVNHLEISREKKLKGGNLYEQGLVDEFTPDMIDACLQLGANEVFLWGADYFAELIPNRNDGCFIVWDKRSNNNDDVEADYQSDKMYGSCFELCWSKRRHKRDIARIKWAGVFGLEQEHDKKRMHPTQKPVKLSAWFLERYGKAHDCVVDLFGGSGSTLIACEQLDRQCYMMELDPHYCDVIIQRWEQYTGQKAELIHG